MLELRAQALEDGLRAGVQADDETAIGHDPSVFGANVSSSTDPDHHPRALADLGEDVALDSAEVLLTVLGEDVRDGVAGALDDEVVGLEGCPAEPLGDQASDLRLAGPREAGEDDAVGPTTSLQGRGAPTCP